MKLENKPNMEPSNIASLKPHLEREFKLLEEKLFLKLKRSDEIDILKGKIIFGNNKIGLSIKNCFDKWLPENKNFKSRS